MPSMVQQSTLSTPGIQSRMRLAYLWTILGSTSRYVAGFGISVVLARLLKPEDYGLIGMMMVFIELLIVFYDSGLGSAVMHFREEHSENERATYFTAALLLGIVSTALLWFAAPLIASFYREPRLILLLRIMSFVLIFGSVRTISGSLLARDLRFKALSAADVFASVVGGLVAIAMAFSGFGVWSLVANLYLFVILQFFIYGWWVRPQFRFPLDMNLLRRIWRYGAPVTGSSLLGRFYENADYLVVGKVLGPVPLGFYTVAFRLAMLINDRISAVVNRVAFPAFANLKEEPETAITHWFAVTRLVTLVTFPLLVWLGFNAKDFIGLVLGSKWLPAVLPLQFLCVMTAVKVLTNIVAQMFSAIGYPKVVFRYDLLTAVILPVAFFIGCNKAGLLGMGIAWCTVFPLLRFAFLIGAKRVLHFSFSAYARNLSDTLSVSTACALFMFPAAWILPSGWARLAVRTLMWALAVLMCVGLNKNLRVLLRQTIVRSRIGT
jgi:teichuronic acid exporter